MEAIYAYLNNFNDHRSGQLISIMSFFSHFLSSSVWAEEEKNDLN